MANSAANVNVAITGVVYTGATSATAPTGAASSLTGFTDLGYISADGITETRDKSTNQIRAWQNADLVREVVTESSASFKMTLLESTVGSLAAFYGAEVDIADGSIAVDPSATGGRKSFVFDVVDGASTIRIYVPSGEVLATDDVVYQNGEAIGYGITITAYPVNGVAFKKFYSALVD